MLLTNIHNTIWKICSELEELVLTFLRSMTCSMGIEQKMCEEWKSETQSMSNVTICVIRSFALENSGISCLAFKFNSVWILQGAETLCSSVAIWRGTEPVSGLTPTLLYCCTLRLYNFVFSEVRQWWSCTDRDLNLTWTSYFQCLGALEVGSLGVGNGLKNCLHLCNKILGFFMTLFFRGFRVGW